MDRRDGQSDTPEIGDTAQTTRPAQGVLSPSTRSAFVAFRGNCTHSLDDKGRTSLPSEFRRALGDQERRGVVLTNYISEGARCIEGFSLSEWERFEARLREKSRFSSKLQRLENFYLSRASECSIDSNGRILVPTYLRAYAGFDKEIVFTASIHGFRMWDKRVWDAIFAASEQALIDNPDLFADVDV
jgi:MraZ protein